MPTEMLALFFVLGCTAMLLVCAWLILAGKRKAAGPRPKRERAAKPARTPRVRNRASKEKEPEPEPEETIERVRTRSLSRIASAARLAQDEAGIRERIELPALPPEPDRSGPILVSRRARLPGDDWEQARSWFGGWPQLSGQAWPISSTGKPMLFVAQLDLGEIKAAAPEAPIPHPGQLAFFIGEGPGQSEAGVVHIPAGTDADWTEPPAGATMAYDPAGDIMPMNPTPWARDSYPFWPVEFTALHVPHLPSEFDEANEDLEDEIIASMAVQVEARAERREYFLSARQAFETLPETAPRFWWRGVHLHAEQLRLSEYKAGSLEAIRAPYVAANIAKVSELRGRQAAGEFGDVLQAELDKALAQVRKDEEQAADYRRQCEGIGAYAAETEAFGAGRNPWEPLTAEELAAFTALFTRGREEFEDVIRSRSSYDTGELALATLQEMMTGDDTAFAALPVPVRDLINRKFLLPTQRWHQMFGPGVDIQSGAVPGNATSHLLLQLMYDDMIQWRFGDMGAFQFWIAPGDLEAGNWSAVQLTFECS